MRRTLVPILLVAFACGDGGDGESGSSSMSTSGQSDSSGSSSTSTTATTSASGSASASESGTTTSSTTDASSSGADTSSGGGMDTSADGSSSGGRVSCEPSPGDDPCIECVKEPCCEHYSACENDDVCACTVDCHLGGASLGSCKSKCGGDSELYEALFFCGQMFCLNTCEWDCC